MAQLRENGPTGDNNAVLKITCYGVAIAFASVTIGANLHFGMGLASSPEEKLLYAIASVAADVTKCVSVLVVMKLWRARSYGLACIGAALGAMALLWSAASATGFVFASRDRTAAVHAAALQSAAGWTAVVRRTGEQLEAVHRHRPEQIIQAELAAELVPASIWRRTTQCAEVTLAESREACARILELRQELAAAQAAAALEERIAEARRQLSIMPVMTATTDSQLTGLAGLVGMEEQRVRRALALLLAMLIELGAASGFALASAATATRTLHPSSPSHPASPPRERASINPAPSAAPGPCEPSKVVELRPSGKRRPGRAASTPDPSISRWAQQCVRRDQRGAVGARSAYKLYCGWAADNGVAGATETSFGRHMSAAISAMGGRKARRGQGAFYLGIRIVPVPAPQPARMAA